MKNPMGIVSTFLIFYEVGTRLYLITCLLYKFKNEVVIQTLQIIGKRLKKLKKYNFLISMPLESVTYPINLIKL